MFGFTWQGIIYSALFAAVGTLCGGRHAYYANKIPQITEKK
jgi:ABC-type lipoprotein release transport system permease subunit